MSDKSKSFEQGFKTGKTWKDDYRPGGPYKLNKPCVGLKSEAGQKQIKLYEENVIHIKEWFEGFDAGLLKRK